jgi:hypothetical protein
MSSITSKPGIFVPSMPPQARPHLVEKFGGDAKASGLPCPMLSTLVNEGRLTPDKDGRVSVEQMKGALRSVGISPLMQQVLAHGGASASEGSFFKKTINLLNLENGSLDHKGSLGPLQGGGFNPEHLARLKSFSTNGTGVTIADLAAVQKLRLAEDGGGLRDKALGIVEIAAFVLIFGRTNAAGDKELSLADLDTIYKDNKLPADFNPKSVNAFNVTWMSMKLAVAQNSSSAAARAEKGLRGALEVPERIDATSMLSIGQMCPAGMRPKGGVGATGDDLAVTHQALQVPEPSAPQTSAAGTAAP